jgi:nucleolar protein 4
MSFAARKKLLATNPALYISKTRLSIRNLPLKTDDKDLKQIGFECITKFKTETKTGQRTDLSPDEKAEGWSFKPFVKQAKIIRSKDRVDSATQKLRSKGYGFLEYRTHSHALAALRYLNNNSKVFPGDPRRLIVEFSVDNKDVVERRTQRAAGGFNRNPGQGDDDAKRTTGRFGGNKRSFDDDGKRPTGRFGGNKRSFDDDGKRPTGRFSGNKRPFNDDGKRPTGRFGGNKRSFDNDGKNDSNKRMRSGPPSRGSSDSKPQRPMMNKRPFNKRK